MKIALFAPYASVSPETGLLYALGNYLRALGSEGVHEIQAIKCNGVAPICDRDGERGWKRGIHSCLSCGRDQRDLANWANITAVELSQFIAGDDVTAIRRWIHRIPITQLLDARWQGFRVVDLVAETLNARCGDTQLDLNNRSHELALQMLLKSAATILSATPALLQRMSPDLCLVANGSDALSSPLVASIKRLQRESKTPTEVSTLKWDVNKRAIAISHPRRVDIFHCELLIPNITEMRSDHRTWSSDLLKILDEILEFLDIPKTQASLPLTQAAN
jgi:hypothetical protein